MKKLFKTVFIYLGVLLLISVASIVLCAGFLFFYRDGNIFGIQYVSLNEVIFAKETANMDNIQTIEVNSGKFDVVVKVSAVEELQGAMRNKVFGYAKKSKAHAKFELNYNNTTKTAVFSSVEPSGLLNKKDCGIEIAVPAKWAESGYNIIVKTSSGDITIAGNKDWLVGDVVVNTGKGDVTLSGITIKNGINAKISAGSLYVDDKCKTVAGITTYLELGSGKMDFSRINKDEFVIKTAEIGVIKRGQIGFASVKELITDGNIGGGGKIELGEVEFVDFTSLDTNININHIIGNGSSTSRIKITGQGKVYINKVYTNIEIAGHNGDVNLSQTMGSVVVSTNQGDLKINNAKGYVSAVTEYGNINVTFGESALDYNISNKNRAIMATTKNGHISVDGLQNGQITATGKGRISLNYNKVVGDNTIKANIGAVNIVVPNPTDTSLINEFAFNMRINSEVNSDIKVGAAGSIGSVNSSSSGVLEFTNIYNSSGSTFNNLKVSSVTGIIKVRSRDLVGF